MAVLAVGVLLCGTVRADAQMCANPGSGGSGTFSGIVNDYYQGNGNLAAGATSLALGTRDTRGPGVPVAVGDLLVVIQMQGASINSSNSSVYGDGTGRGMGTTGVGTTGYYDFVTVASVAGSTVTFSPALTHAYTQSNYTASAGQKRYQVVRVPQYANATAAGITAPAWNGLTGGTVVLDVRDTLTLGSATVEGQTNRAIFVAGKGFRGAAGYNSTANSPNTDWASPGAGAHGGKGEGIAGAPRFMALKKNGYGAKTVNPVTGTTQLSQLDTGVEGYPGGSHARGAPGNGGGGGTDGGTTTNEENAGGGGGGGYADGGIGGRPWNAPLTDTDGRGGSGYSGVLNFNRVFMGGGGGGGGTNNNTSDAGVYENAGISCAGVGALCSSGGAGGGVVIIRARTIIGTGVIDARGANGYNTANDAAGGGGGGGSVVLYTVDGGTPTVNASGGDGGNAWAGGPAGINNRHGPGGGGGGGFVAYAPNSMLINATLSGGVPGRTTNGPDDHYTASGYAGGLTTFQPPDMPGTTPGALCAVDLSLQKSNGTDILFAGSSTSYGLTVVNNGTTATSGTITVVDVLPAGLAVSDGPLSLTGAQAVDWACSASSNVVTCTSSTAIAGTGSSSFAFSADVVGTDGTAVVNLARVGGGGDPNKGTPTQTTTGNCTGNNTPAGCAVDTDTINAPFLQLSKSDATDEVRAGGTTSYSLTVHNAGSQPTSGTVRVVDALPSGMNYVGASPFNSGGFSCSWASPNLTCDRTSVLASGATTTIVFPVSVAGNAPSALVNRARIGGGNDPGKPGLPTSGDALGCPAPSAPDTTASDSSTGCASDVDSVTHVNLVLAKSNGGATLPTNGQTTYVFTVSNTGDADSVGTIEFRDVLPSPLNWPASLTVAGPDAANWACARISASTVSCTSTAVIPVGGQSQFSILANVGGTTNGTQYINKARIAGGGDTDLLSTLGNADVTRAPATTILSDAPRIWIRRRMQRRFVCQSRILIRSRQVRGTYSPLIW